MAFISRVSFSTFLKLREASVKIPSTYVQLRWLKKEPKRKPKWLPTAPSKLYRIIEHPYVSPEEKQLQLDLHEEYYTQIESMRKMFQEELAQKNKEEGKTLKGQQEEEEKFLLLLEENKKENERIKVIREATIEKLFQEQQLEFMQLEESRKIQEQETKARIEKIVREQKEITKSYITHSNLDEAVERALDSPRNFNFTIDVNGKVNFEGNPPPDFEEDIKQRIAQSAEK
ncbi:hypothetical protein JTE90_026695 [Oedothorax gibbosus]|uniref:Small ribosomal subunit protein mS26 n=1 Tax=Oedothorax gibbosus TaxID=931172 RepID=A0AAV6V266_9ARAC|nr:hypothetical protein JTE90_026695 [Oedothorax gibbosus]